MSDLNLIDRGAVMRKGAAMAYKSLTSEERAAEWFDVYTRHPSKIRQYTNRMAYEFEEAVQKEYGGVRNVSFKDGWSGIGGKQSCRPDIVRIVNGAWEAIECKCYASYSAWHYTYQPLAQALKRQIESRVQNLPHGFRQRIVLEDFGYTDKEKSEMVEEIRKTVDAVYPHIPIDFFRMGGGTT